MSTSHHRSHSPEVGAYSQSCVIAKHFKAASTSPTSGSPRLLHTHIIFHNSLFISTRIGTSGVSETFSSNAEFAIRAMSAILSADDLNDFISPGVACIKPVETLPKEDSSNPYEVTTEEKVQAKNPAPASISLTDCLACSGCVTSAEAVLVSLQSHTEVLNTLDSHSSLDLGRISNGKYEALDSGPELENARLFVASVSPQVRASIAATFGISERDAGFMIEQFLSGSQGLRIGGSTGSYFQYVVDTNTLREACLVLGADEVANAASLASTARPILTSACPGWVCYAEKTHPHVLPHMSKLKSPQALAGTLLKSVLSKKFGIHPSQIWHLAIMPCFDKKLEASREELTDKWWSASRPESRAPIRDVDCVITSRELLTLADARGIQLASLPLRPHHSFERPHFPDDTLSRFLMPKPRRRNLQQPAAGTSGGYLYHILKTEQTRNAGSSISIQQGRNADVIEYTLVSSMGKTIFRCARYYGFRNIQNLVRKLKPPKASKMPGAAMRRRAADGSASGSDYTYVEVMACPGGCTNGGGQLKIDDVAFIIPQTRGEELVVDKPGPQSQREWLARVDETYYSADSEQESSSDGRSDVTEDSDDVQMASASEEDTDMQETSHDYDLINGLSHNYIHSVLEHWSNLVGVPLEKLAYTTFRQVESDVGKNRNLDDSQRIAAVAGMQGGGW